MNELTLRSQYKGINNTLRNEIAILKKKLEKLKLQKRSVKEKLKHPFYLRLLALLNEDIINIILTYWCEGPEGMALSS